MPITVTTLLRTPLLAIQDVRCDGDRDGTVECSAVDVLVLARTGSFSVRRRHDEQLVDANRALAFRAGEPYVARHGARTGDRTTVIAPSPELAAELRHDGGLPTHALVPAALDLAHRRLVRGLERNHLPPHEAEGLGLRILESAVGGASADGGGTSAWGTMKPAHRRLVRRTIELMAGDPAAPLDLRDLARRLGVSPYHLSRTFRRVVGLTLSRYHARLRVRAAIEGLLAGMPIAALAQEAGFADQSHLAHAVRAELDLTPGQLRRLGSN